MEYEIRLYATGLFPNLLPRAVLRAGRFQHDGAFEHIWIANSEDDATNCLSEIQKQLSANGLRDLKSMHTFYLWFGEDESDFFCAWTMPREGW